MPSIFTCALLVAIPRQLQAGPYMCTSSFSPSSRYSSLSLFSSAKIHGDSELCLWIYANEIRGHHRFDGYGVMFGDSG